MAVGSETRRAAADRTIAQLLRNLFDLPEAASEDIVQTTIGDWLEARDPELLSVTDEILWLLGMRELETQGRRDVNADALRHRAGRVAQLMFVLASQEHPLLLLIENLHWVDPTSRALLDQLLPSINSRRILVLATSRPGARAELALAKANARTLHLGPLGREDAELLLSTHLGRDPSLDALKALISRETGNNPLFIEETLDDLVEQGILVGSPGGRRLTAPVTSLHVPSTIATVISARLDRLRQTDKRLVQVAAIFGQPTPIHLVAEVAGTTADAVEGSMSALEEAGFLTQTKLFSEPELSVAHALIRDVVYRGLLKDNRRRLHRRAFQALQNEALHGLGCDFDKLGHHADEAELFDLATDLLGNAGRSAYRRSAYREAVELLERAIRAAKRADAGTSLIDLHLDLRDALFALGDLEAVRGTLEAAERDAKATMDHRRLATIHALFINHHLSVGDPQAALVSAANAVTLARKVADPVAERNARFHRIQIHASVGSYCEAATEARALLDGLHGETARDDRATTMVSMARMWSLWCFAELGQFEDAADLLLEAQDVVATPRAPFDTPLDLAIAALGSGLFWLRRGLIDAQCLELAVDTLEPALRLARRHELASWVPAIASPLGHALTLRGDPQTALPLLQEAVDQTVSRHGTGNALRVCHLARAHLALGQFDLAQKLVEKGLALARRSREAGHGAYTLEARGLVMAAAGNAPQARRCLKKALACAERLLMKPLAHSCRTSLAQIDRCRQRLAVPTR